MRSVFHVSKWPLQTIQKWWIYSNERSIFTLSSADYSFTFLHKTRSIWLKMEGKVWCFHLRLNECFCEWSLVALRGRYHSLNSCYLWGKMSCFVDGVWWIWRVEERTTKTGSSLEYHVFWPEPKPPSRKLKLKVFDNWTSPRRRQVRRRCSVAAASVFHYGKWTLDSRTQLMFVGGDTQVVLFIVSFEILWRRRDVRESGQHRERRWRGCRTLSWKPLKEHCSTEWNQLNIIPGY